MGSTSSRRSLVAVGSTANALGGVAFTLAGTLLPLRFWTAVGLLLVGLILLMVTPIALDRIAVKSEALVAKSEALTAEAEALKARLEERLRGLATFVELVHGLLEIDAVNDLRATLLQVDRSENPPRFKQVARCDCAGQCKPGETSMFVNQGVAGRCYLRVKTAQADFHGGDFVESMSEFGFSPAEARQFQPRKAYLCSPVVNAEREVIAVLSLDAVNPNVFTPDHAEVAEWVTPFFARFLIEPKVSGGDHVSYNT
jgi:hypothetical protein